MKRTFRLSDARPDARRDVSDEIEFHLEMRTKEFIEKGLAPDDARRAAAASFGDAAAIAAECREVRVQRTRERRRRDWMRGMSMDVTYALRTLRKSPAFTAAAVLTLALGIGATAAVFTIVNGVLLRPLPYGDPSRIAMVWITGDPTYGTASLPLTSGFFIDVRTQSRSFASVAAFRSWPYNLGDVSEPEQLAGARVTPSLFGTLGVRPLIGRTFTEAEAVVGAPSVAIISHALWQRRFGGATSIVGQRITLSGERFTVIGVMPPGFSFPRGAELPGGLQFHERTDLWTPLIFAEGDAQNYGTMNLAATARLAPGVTHAQADAELDAIMKRFLEQANVKVPYSYTVVELREQAAAPVRRGLLILLGAVALVLVIACANVANLMLARTAGRQRELAVRSALGAGRARIARQLVTENVIVALAGAALGVLLAVWGSRVMLSLVPGNLPRADDVSLDWRVLATTLGIALLAGTVFGVATAMVASRHGLAETLQSAGARLTGGTRRRLGRRLLVATEVALSLVLLIGAGLLTGSFARLQRVSPGFTPHGAIVADVLLPVTGNFNPLRDGPRWAAFFTQLQERLNASPGVVAAGAVSSLALSGAFESGGFRIDGAPRPLPGQSPLTEYQVIAGNYFKAMGIPLVAGRAFDARDRADSPPVVIISEEFARKHFPRTNPLGQRIIPTFDFTGSAREIVGIATNVKQTSLDGGPAVQSYVPETQMPYPFLSVVVRTSGDAAAALPILRREVKALDPSLALAKVRLLEDVFTESLARQRFSMIVIGVFAGSALALALVGLYGVIALSVGQRRREIGVRLALGARPADVLRMILGEGMGVTVVGLVAGLAAAFAVTRVLRSLLYDMSATDPAIYAGAAVIVAVVAAVATYFPARRATGVDATVALRAE